MNIAGSLKVYLLQWLPPSLRYWYYELVKNKKNITTSSKDLLLSMCYFTFEFNSTKSHYYYHTVTSDIPNLRFWNWNIGTCSSHFSGTKNNVFFHKNFSEEQKNKNIKKLEFFVRNKQNSVKILKIFPKKCDIFQKISNRILKVC